MFFDVIPAKSAERARAGIQEMAEVLDSRLRRNTSRAFGAPMGMKVRNEASHAAIVIASDQRERGNLTVFGTAKNGEMASVAALPRNDRHGVPSGQ